MTQQKTVNVKRITSSNKIICKNGIAFKTDIVLQTDKKVKSGWFPLFQFLMTTVVSLSAIYMLLGFFNLDENLPHSLDFTYQLPVFITAALTAFSILLLNTSYLPAKLGGAAYLIANTIFFLFKLNSIVNGMADIVYKYCANAKMPHPLFWERATDIAAGDTNMFLLAFTFINTMLLSLACIYRLSFPLLFICTFPIFELGTFWGWETYTWTVAIMLISWIIVLSLNMINHSAKRRKGGNTFAIYRKKKAYYMTNNDIKRKFFGYASSFVLRIVSLVLVCCILAASLSGNYRPSSFKKLRYDISTGFESFTESVSKNFSGGSGEADIPGRDKAIGGINGGQLGLYDKISFNGSTALTLSSDLLNQRLDYSIYLRGYTGERYSDNNWNPDKVSDEIKDLFDKDDFTPLDYGYIQQYAFDDDQSYSAELSVKAVGASNELIYAPYFTLYSASDNFDKETYSGIAEPEKKSQSTDEIFLLPYADSIDEVVNQAENRQFDGSDIYKGYSDYSDYVYSHSEYTYVPNELLQVLNEINKNSGATDTAGIDQKKKLITEYLSQQGFTYSTSPGVTPAGKDFIEYFLTEQKAGYCTYYASAGVMLMRAMGYPSRYVEGYVLSPEQTGVDSEVKLSDRCAHAWCEVYIYGVGWLPLEFTPGYETSNPNLTEKEKNITDNSSSQGSIESDSSQAIEETSSADEETDTVTQNDSQPESRSENSRTDTSSNTTDSVKTADGQVGSGGEGTGGDNGSGASGTEKGGIDTTTAAYISLSAIFAAAIAAAIVLRRIYSVKKLDERINNPDCNKAIIACYETYFRYLKLVGIKSDGNITDMQMTSSISKELAKKYPMLQKPFELLSEYALTAYMGGIYMSEKQAYYARQSLNQVKELVYGELSPYEKISAIIIHNLY